MGSSTVGAVCQSASVYEQILLDKLGLPYKFKFFPFYYYFDFVSPPSFHEKTGVGDTEAHMTGPLGEDTEAGGQDGIDDNHLTINKSPVM